MAPKTKEKLKPSSPSPSQALAAIEDLFSSLNRHIQRSKYELAVKVVDQVLAINPADEDALHCKIVALIKADNIDGTLSTIQASEKAKFPIDYGFFKAVYQKNGNLFFRTSIQKAITAEQRQLDSAKAKLQKLSAA